MEVSFNILDFPNEILMKIVKFAQNDKSLSQTCKKFYELISKLNEKNVSLCVDYRYLINPAFDIDNFLQSSASISLTIDYEFSSIKNYNEKLEDFMKFYGYKIKNLTIACEISNFTTKILPMLKNLETLEFHHEILFDDSKIEKLSVKIKKLKIFCNFDLNKLHIFDFEQLEIKTICFKDKEKLQNFLQKHKSIKKVRVIDHNRDNFDLEKFLKYLQLESLDFFIRFKKDKIVANSLKYQKELKELTLFKTSIETFNSVCENLKDLEKLEFGVPDDTTLSDFIKISNLKKLKVLSIKQMSVECFIEFSKIIFENLKDLTLSLHMEFTENLFDNFLQNYSKLKSLDLTILELKCLKVITNVLEKFNNLESLHLYFQISFEIEKSEIEEFYKTNHKNVKLKTLTFNGRTFETKKLITKFIHDFPNLENLDSFDSTPHKLRENFEVILKGFPKLKIIENLVITEEMLGTFLKHGKNLEKFQIDINMLENPNEILKDCSIALKVWETSASITRENARNIKLTMMIYNHWKKIKTLMDSKMKLRNLILSLGYCKFQEKLFTNHMKNFLQNVTNLTIQKDLKSSQIETILKAVPNLEILVFNCIFFQKDSENILQIENEKIRSICLHSTISNFILKHKLFEFNEFLTYIKFPKNSMNHVKILIKDVENFKDENIYEKIEDSVIGQQQVKKKFINWNENAKEYSYEIIF
ncbi:hypothetical protein PVAND_015644 [Polypedilum vanderplanki]|uniref:F-box domain-containing protein n=1 Tax=Polypedilum vanderplanki TaxID=319348 RepID=A0A9J6BDL2_POLVA|nr:hypothetical protein PVAND_015644 [Polypedilum vanderplanki]